VVLFAPGLVLEAPEGTSPGMLRWLVATMGVVAVLGIPLSVGNVAFYASERFLLLNAIQIAGTVARIALVILLLSVFPTSLLAYAAGDAAAALVTAVATCIVGVRLLPGASWGIAAADRGTARMIAGYGAEVFLNTLVFLLFLQADYFLIGRTLGPGAVTVFYLAAIWGMLARSVIGSAVSVVLPTAAGRDAVGDREALRTLLVRSTKYALLAGAAPILFLCAFRHRVVTAWMGEGYETTAVLMLPLLLADLLTLGTAGANDVFTGLGRVRVFTLTSLASGLVNVVLVLLWTGVLGLGLEAVAWTYFGVFLVRSAIVLPWWTSRELEMPAWRLYRDGWLPPARVAVVAVPVLWALHAWLPDTGWSGIVLASAAFFGCLAPLVWLVGLDGYDRRVLTSLARRAGPTSARVEGNEP
jgi:O-antigen/teichoic acid export membrane protein